MSTPRLIDKNQTADKKDFYTNHVHSPAAIRFTSSWTRRGDIQSLFLKIVPILSSVTSNNLLAMMYIGGLEGTICSIS